MATTTTNVTGENGDWQLTTGRATGGKNDEIVIKFTPKKKGTCDDIRLSQAVTKIGYDKEGKAVARNSDELFTEPKDNPFGHTRKDDVEDKDKNATHIDHKACEFDPYYNGDTPLQSVPSPGNNTSGPPGKPTAMGDSPGGPLTGVKDDIVKVVSTYETCTVCIETGEILGCITYTSTTTRDDEGKIDIVTKDKDKSPSDSFEKAFKKFAGNHQEKDGSGTLRWHCPEQGVRVMDPDAKKLIEPTPWGPEIPEPFRKKWLAQRQPWFLGQERIGDARIGDRRFAVAPEQIYGKGFSSPDRCAVKFTWSGLQDKNTPSVVFSAISDLAPAEIAPFIPDEARFRNDFTLINFQPTTSALMRDLVASIGEIGVSNNNGPVLVTLAVNLRSESATALVGSLEPGQLGSLLQRISGHPDVDQTVLETLNYLVLNMAETPAYESVRLRPDASLPSLLDEKLNFYRVRIGLNCPPDCGPTAPSRWGAVDLSYAPAPRLMYFNLSVRSGWLLRNVPVFPTLEQVDQYTQSMYFDLGSEGLSRIQYGYALTAFPIETIPALNNQAELLTRSETYYSGIHDELMGPLADSPQVWNGSGFPDVLYCRLDYPNQPCGKNECGPTAVSNSLRWLKKEYGLEIPEDQLTIDAWKDILQWAGDGVKNGNWANFKVNYCNDKNKALPVDSEKLPGAHIAEALKQFEKGQAVEMYVGNHITALICMGKDSDGNYVVNAISDAAQEGQDKKGNPVSQVIKIDKDGNTTSGPAWAVGKNGAGLKVQNFLVQCPHPNKWKK
jgi:hypothetical protein